MGSGQAVCETIKPLLEKRGWQVSIASPKKNKILRLLDMLATVIKKRHQYEVAVIEVFSGQAFIWAEIVAFFFRQLRKPFILTLYGGNLPPFAKKHPTRVKKLFSSANGVFSPTEYTRQLMLPYDPSIKVLHYGVDLSLFQFLLRDQAKPRLISIRAFHQVYNLKIAPIVLSLLVAKFPDIKLTMTGSNKHDGTLEQVISMAKEHNVSDHLDILGFLDRDLVPNTLNQSDILLNTTNIDNTPVSVIEAMACGLCIVSTNVGGIPYLLENEVDALLVPPNDPMAMSKAVERILVEPGLAGRLSANARKKAEKFSWSVVLPQWEEVFEEVINDFSSKR